MTCNANTEFKLNTGARVALKSLNSRVYTPQASQPVRGFHECEQSDMIRYRYGRSIWEIDTGDRTSMRFDRDIDMGYELSIWDMVYRFGHPGYRCGIWANDVGDDSIDTVILRIDVGYLVTPV